MTIKTTVSFASIIMFSFLFECTPAIKKVDRNNQGEGKQASGNGPQVVSDVVVAEEKPAAENNSIDWESPDDAQKKVFQDIYYEFNLYALQNSNLDILSGIVKAMNANKDFKITIEGHCDERGSDEYNLALGEKRAEGVRNYLSKSGINEGRMKIISYGEERPAVPGHTEEAFSKNRRVHFEVHK